MKRQWWRFGKGSGWAARRELVNYFVASMVALAVDLVAFSFTFRVLELTWWLAATLGFVLGAGVAYVLSIAWVFTDRRMITRPRLEFLVFAMIGIAGLGITQFVLWIGIEKLHALPELMKLLAAGLTFAFNFFVRKLALFTLPGVDS